MGKHEFTVPSEADGERIDTFLTKHEGITSRNFAQQLISRSLVKVNGETVPKSRKLKIGETVAFEIPSSEKTKARPARTSSKSKSPKKTTAKGSEKAVTVSKVIGIDFGTHNSLACMMDLTDSNIIMHRDKMGRSLVPSVVAYDPKKKCLLAGHQALRHRGSKPEPITSIKRWMGSEKIFKLGSREMTPVEISAEILKEAKNQLKMAIDAQEILNTSFLLDRAIITTPAYFNLNQKEETREAGKLAGLEVVEILDEPTAAVIYYDWKHKIGDGFFMVYDLRRATLGVSIIKRTAGECQVLGTAGDNSLGGDDFDRRLAGYILEMLVEDGVSLDLDLEGKLEDRLKFTKLMMLAEDVKKKLSDKDVVYVNDQTLFADNEGINVVVDMEITRETFNGLIGDLVDSTIPCCEEALQKAEENGGVTLEQIDHILLVGGSTYVPLVQQKIRDTFCDRTEGKPRAKCKQPLVDEPEFAVAKGAAIRAAANNGVKLYDDGNRVVIALENLGGTSKSTCNLFGKVESVDEGINLAGGIIRMAMRQGDFNQEKKLGEKGKFSFKKVPLQADTVTSFDITILDRQGQEVASLTSGVSQDLEHKTKKDITSAAVLGKPLCCEVIKDGKFEKVVLFHAMTSLPAESCFTYYTTDQSGIFHLRLFERKRALKEIRIENIDTSLPIGTPIEIHLHIDEMKYITGYGKVSGKEFPIDIPPLPEGPLPSKADFDQLLAEFEENLAYLPSGQRMAFRAKRERVCRDIKEAFSSLPEQEPKLRQRMLDLEELTMEIQDSVPESVEQTGNSEPNTWKCSCGASNPKDLANCSNCFRGRDYQPSYSRPADSRSSIPSLPKKERTNPFEVLCMNPNADNEEVVEQSRELIIDASEKEKQEIRRAVEQVLSNPMKKLECQLFTYLGADYDNADWSQSDQEFLYLFFESLKGAELLFQPEPDLLNGFFTAVVRHESADRLHSALLIKDRDAVDRLWHMMLQDNAGNYSLIHDLALLHQEWAEELEEDDTGLASRHWVESRKHWFATCCSEDFWKMMEDGDADGAPDGKQFAKFLQDFPKTLLSIHKERINEYLEKEKLELARAHFDCLCLEIEALELAYSDEFACETAESIRKTKDELLEEVVSEFCLEARSKLETGRLPEGIRKNYKSAIAHVKKLLELDPLNKKALTFALAQYYDWGYDLYTKSESERQNLVELTIEARSLVEGLAGQTESGQGHLPENRALAKNYLLQGFATEDTAEAVALFEKALKYNPHYKNAQDLLEDAQKRLYYERERLPIAKAMTDLANKQFDSAIRRLEDHRKQHSDNIEATRLLAAAYNARAVGKADKDDLAGAVKDLKEAKVLDPSDQQVSDNLNRAEERLRHERERQPIADALRDFESKRFDAAITKLESYRQGYPGNAEAKTLLAAAYNTRGVTKAERGDFTSAKRDLEQALSLDPSEPKIRDNLNAVESNAKNQRERDALRSSVDAINSGYFDRAIRSLESFLSNNPGNQNAEALLAAAYNGRGVEKANNFDFAGAGQDLIKAFQLDPSNEKIKQNLTAVAEAQMSSERIGGGLGYQTPYYQRPTTSSRKSKPDGVIGKAKKWLNRFL